MSEKIYKAMKNTGALNIVLAAEWHGSYSEHFHAPHFPRTDQRSPVHRLLRDRTPLPGSPVKSP